MNTIFKHNVRIDRLFGGDAARQRAQSYADQRSEGYEVRDLGEVPRTEQRRAGLDPFGKREGIQYTCAVVEVSERDGAVGIHRECATEHEVAEGTAHRQGTGTCASCGEAIHKGDLFYVIN